MTRRYITVDLYVDYLCMKNIKFNYANITCRHAVQ